jgi:hypothetical protein
VLLLGFAAAVALAFSSFFGATLETSIESFNATLERDLNPGNLGAKKLEIFR